MGAIRTEVREQHLNHYPDEEDFLKDFLPAFFVTWARHRRAYNTDLSVYILSPESGMNRLLLVSYTEYDGNVRIISARMATRREAKDYEEG